MYDDSVIKKELAVHIHSLHRFRVFKIQEHTLESEESYDGFGVNPREEKFYPMVSVDSQIEHEDALGGLHITLSHQSTQHTRTIYSALDFLGDVGGLFDMLRLVA